MFVPPVWLACLVLPAVGGGGLFVGRVVTFGGRGWGVCYQARDVRGCGALVMDDLGFLPSLLLQLRCMGSRGPVIDPPLPTAAMWLAVKAIGFFQ